MAETYKNLFCKAGEVKYKTCKRYMVSEATGVCPDFVMPNSSLGLEAIKERMAREGLI